MFRLEMRRVFVGRIFAVTLAASAVIPIAARAGFTVIEDSPDQWDEPNLLGMNPFPGNPNPSVLETLYGEENLRRVNDDVDVAFRHTGDVATVRAVAHFTSGVAGFGYLPNRSEPYEDVLIFVSSLGGYNPQTEGTGTIDVADSGPVFELHVIDSRRTSNPAKNPFGRDMLVTFEIVGNDGHLGNPIGSYVLAWEDRYVEDSDWDFQDFVFEISGVSPVPEPTTFALALAALCLAVIRRC